MRKPSRTKCLLITYVRNRKEAGAIGNDGYIHAVITRLIENSIFELHEYVRIFLISGVKIPIVILRLRGRVMDPLDSLSPFLS